MKLEQEELATLRIKVDVLTAATTIWSKKLQKTLYWQVVDDVKRWPLDLLQGESESGVLEKKKNGGNGDIQKCCIKGESTISKYWEFLVKTQKGETEAIQKMQFNVEAKALQTIHEGCIKWIAIHPFEPKGYTLWWNEEPLGRC